MTGLIRQHYNNPAKIGYFYLDRLARLYPQFLFYVTLKAVLNAYTNMLPPYYDGQLNYQNILFNLTLIPLGWYALFPDMTLLIAPTWSLGLEANFYLLFPLLLLYRKEAWFLIASLCIFIVAYLDIIDTNLWGYRFLLGTLFIFLSGSLLFQHTSRFRHLQYSVYGIVIGLFIIAYTDSQLWELQFNKEVLLGYLIGVPIISFISRFHYSRFDQFLGNVSYGVFLNHFIVIDIFRFNSISLDNVYNIALLVLVSSVLALITYLFIERPVLSLRRFLRKHS